MAVDVGFANSISRGIDTGIRLSASRRRARQQELENKLKGFDLTEDGTYVPNELGNAYLDNSLKTQQVQGLRKGAMLDAFKGVDAIEVINPIKELAVGNIAGAWDGIKSNTNLLKGFQAIGINALEPLDLNSDKALLETAGLNYKNINPNDAEAVKAVAQGLVKVQDAKGNWSVKPIQQIVEASGVTDSMHQFDKDALVTRMNSYNDIYFGRKILTRQEKADANVIRESALAKARLNIAKDGNMLKAINNLTKENPNYTPSDLLAVLNPPKSLTPLQKYNIESTKYTRSAKEMESKALIEESKRTGKSITQLRNEYKAKGKPISVAQQKLDKAKVKKAEEDAIKLSISLLKDDNGEPLVHYSKATKNIDDGDFTIAISNPTIYKDPAKRELLYNYATIAEAKNKPSSSLKKKGTEALGALGVAQKIDRVIDLIDKAPFDFKDKAIQATLNTYNPIGKEFTEEQKDTLRAKGAIGQFLVQYNKLMSGLAVSDNEFVRSKVNLLGAKYTDFTSKEASLVSIKQFRDGIIKDMDTINQEIALVMPKTFMDIDKYTHEYKLNAVRKEYRKNSVRSNRVNNGARVVKLGIPDTTKTSPTEQLPSSDIYETIKLGVSNEK